MKTFTARDLGRKRGEIRQAIKDGGCIVQYKHSDRTLEMECVMLSKDGMLDDMLWLYEKYKHKLPEIRIAKCESYRVEMEKKRSKS